MDEDLAIDILQIIRKGDLSETYSVFNELKTQDGFFDLTEKHFKETWNKLKDGECLVNHNQSPTDNEGVKINPSKKCLSFLVERRTLKMLPEFYKSLISLLNESPDSETDVTDFLSKFWLNHPNEDEIRSRISSMIRHSIENKWIGTNQDFHDILTATRLGQHLNERVKLVLLPAGKEEFQNLTSTHSPDPVMVMGGGYGVGDYSFEAVTKKRVNKVSMLEKFAWVIVSVVTIFIIWEFLLKKLLHQE